MPIVKNLKLNKTGSESLKDYVKNKEAYSSVFNDKDTERMFYLNDNDLFYGKVDTKNNLLIPNQNFLVTIDKNSNILINDIVGYAFFGFQQYFTTAQSVINRNSVFYKIEPSSGYKSVHYEYKEYLQNFYREFINILDLRYEKKIKTVENFFDIFIEFCTYFIKINKMPLTRTGFIASNYCTPEVTGLIIDIATNDHEDDQTKYDKYIKDLNFDFYLETATRYNFLVEKERPWRLIFNLRDSNLFDDNPIIDCDIKLRDKGILKLFGLKSLDEFFISRYFKSMIGTRYSETTEIQNMKIIFIQMYNQYIASRPSLFHANIDQNNEIKMARLDRDPVEEENLLNKIDISLWIKALLYFRALESNQRWNQTEFNNFYKKSLVMYNSYGLRHAVNFINDVTKNIFDVDRASNLLVERDYEVNKVFKEEEKFKF